MFITGLGTAVPATKYRQAECWDVLQASKIFGELQPRSRAILKKVLLGNNGIATRHLALNSLHEAFEMTPDALHARFAEHAPALATAAAERALTNAGLAKESIDGVLISTCTGYLCPGLTSYVSERLGLRPDVIALDLVGQGCVAALPNLRMGEALLSSRRCQHVLSVCVEICSAAMYIDDDPGVLISACLFGDAAGAAVLSTGPAAQTRPVEWLAADSVLNPSARDLLRFEQRQGMLRNILTPAVPALAAEHAQRVFQKVTQAAGVKQEQIKAWIWHAGGRDILLALKESFRLADEDLRWSATVLRDLGNISSSCVYHVLQRAMNSPAGYWWLGAFGAGFSSQGALLRVGEP
ncbi:MAG TPA: 3-oxoacyl-[acyl-carrier-protein] synthase III C-terminal domain-containing protein [Candidatus Saccharimonadales bacterium]|nr:3-oxoacyl-[acyl-carrier-protein] synthase III C-terminal domain-containing protein [Candidatus Saccharimonadales bacterium]